MNSIELNELREIKDLINDNTRTLREFMNTKLESDYKLCLKIDELLKTIRL